MTLTRSDRFWLATLIAIIAAAVVFGACVSTPSGPKFTTGAAQGLDAAFAAACPLEALAAVPVAAACPAEEAAFAAAIASETAPATPAASASTVPPAPASPAAVALYRRPGPGERGPVPVGVLPASHPHLAACQRRAWAIVGPFPVADAGAEGGR